MYRLPSVDQLSGQQWLSLKSQQDSLIVGKNILLHYLGKIALSFSQVRRLMGGCFHSAPCPLGITGCSHTCSQARCCGQILADLLSYSLIFSSYPLHFCR